MKVSLTRIFEKACKDRLANPGKDKMGMTKTVTEIRAAVNRMGEKLTTGHLVAVIQTLNLSLHNDLNLQMSESSALTFLSVMGEAE